MSIKFIGRLFLAIAIASPLPLSCSRIEPRQDTEQEIRFRVATGESTDIPLEQGDAVSLFADVPVNVVNLKLTYASTGTLTPANKVLWGKGQISATSFTAIYPYSSSYTSAHNLNFTVKSDQSSEADFRASDLMVASTGAKPSDAAVTLPFKHRMAKLEISVDNRSGESIKSLTVQNVCLSYNLTDKQAAGNGQIIAHPLQVVAKYEIVLAPQKAEPEIVVVTSTGSSYEFKLESAMTFAEGSRSTASICVEGGDVPPTPPSPSGDSTRPWFEMPGATDADADGVDDSNSSYYYAYHHFSSGSSSIRNYSVCFSSTYHCPLWVAAPRHPSYKGDSGRTDAYMADPDIPADIQYSSKSAGDGCNKGHMLGSASRTVSLECNQQVFYYTNIAPQYSAGYNTGGGGWNLVEDFVDSQVCSDTLYQVIGCYFEEYTDAYGFSAAPKEINFGGRSDVACPTMFYTVLLRTRKGSSGKAVSACTATELQCVALVRAHNSGLKGQKVSSKDMMSVSDLEKITGFRYFVNVPVAPKDSFNANDWL